MVGKALVLTLFVAGWSASSVGEEPALVTIIPCPEKIELHEGVFTLTPQTTIHLSTEACDLGAYLAAMLSTPTGFPLARGRRLDEMGINYRRDPAIWPEAK